MSRPKPKLADHVHLVIGIMPYECSEVISAWVTKDAAEDEKDRLTKLAEDYGRNHLRYTDAKANEITEQTKGYGVFNTQSIDVMHKEAEHG